MDLSFLSYDPHRILGIHDGRIIVWRPSMHEVTLLVRGNPTKMHAIGDGLFALEEIGDLGVCDYLVMHPNGLFAHDPYAFLPTWGDMDVYLFAKGVHYKLYDVLGARIATHQGIDGVKFSVWAPNAMSVSVVGDFSHWDARFFPMRSLGSSGVWELFIPGLFEGEKYKFCIATHSGDLLYKMDPMAYASEKRPATASVIFDVDAYVWKHAHVSKKQPMAIYEVHLGSWRRGNYVELAPLLARYVKEMGFTHIEFLPLNEHPLDESWGYQVTGFYAVTSRFGSPREFQQLVDILHAEGIGVIVDWVPGHFPDDDFSLYRFDGSHLYEHQDPRQGWHPHWHTRIFNYERHEVANFLLGSALFWFAKMHVDGLRVDAVASMLYLDYGRHEGEWIPNRYGGKENIEAIAFIKHLNAVVHEYFPHALMIAEESTSFPKVTHALENDGLGFDRKWNMGWMNDTLRYFQTDPIFRIYDHQALTFGLLYAFSEKFLLTLSHDEVVHGKGSLLSKMKGSDWQKFANMRLLYSYMICQPGEKLLFMGGELGVWREWNCREELDWFLLDYPLHHGLQLCVRDLNLLYQNSKALWEQEHSPSTFTWVDFADRKNSVISYLRCSNTEMLYCVHNFTPTYFATYEVQFPKQGQLLELLNTDNVVYGGSGKIHTEPLTVDHGILRFSLAPLASMIFRFTEQY